MTKKRGSEAKEVLYIGRCDSILGARLFQIKLEDDQQISCLVDDNISPNVYEIESCMWAIAWYAVIDS